MSKNGAGRASKGDTRRALGNGDGDDSGRTERRRDGEKRRRDSKKSDKSRSESSRAIPDDNHNASLVQNQFPGEFPSMYAEPYRPPGLAADYYGDQGESVQFQPGVRPQPPSIIQAADQAHLHKPTVVAQPPPEPSSLGQVGAAASFYEVANGGDNAYGSTPLNPPHKESLKPTVHSNGGTSPWSSPGPDGRIPTNASSGGGIAGPVAAAAVAAGVGLAAEYYTGNIPKTGPNNHPPGTLSQVGQNYAQSEATHYTTQSETTYTTAPTSRPQRPPANPSLSSNMPLYGAAAAAGLAGVAA